MIARDPYDIADDPIREPPPDPRPAVTREQIDATPPDPWQEAP